MIFEVLKVTSFKMQKSKFGQWNATSLTLLDQGATSVVPPFLLKMMAMGHHFVGAQLFLPIFPALTTPRDHLVISAEAQMSQKGGI